MSDLEEINRSIGNLEGKIDLMLKEQSRQNKRDETLDARLRTTEVKAARNGLVSGGLIAITISIIKESIKSATG